MIFDVKTGSMKRKARYVARGYETEPPAPMAFDSVVRRESVQLAFMIAASNDLSILSADIQNSYLKSPCKEKLYTVLGQEFRSHRQGQKALLIQALYGLKCNKI
jgi:hypothetical protein